MKKKLISLMLVLVMPMLVLCGCSESFDTETNKTEQVERFVRVYYKGDFMIYVDRETRVMYIVLDIYNGGGMQVMVNPKK